MLSPALLDILHRWWKEGRASGLLLNGSWLFPGENPVNPISIASCLVPLLPPQPMQGSTSG
jgi:hypothetical protein